MSSPQGYSITLHASVIALCGLLEEAKRGKEGEKRITERREEKERKDKG